jgi:hypothetical protein
VMRRSIPAIQCVGLVEAVYDPINAGWPVDLEWPLASSDPGGEVDRRDRGNVVGMIVRQQNAVQPLAG